MSSIHIGFNRNDGYSNPNIGSPFSGLPIEEIKVFKDYSGLFTIDFSDEGHRQPLGSSVFVEKKTGRHATTQCTVKILVPSTPSPNPEKGIHDLGDKLKSASSIFLAEVEGTTVLFFRKIIQVNGLSIDKQLSDNRFVVSFRLTLSGFKVYDGSSPSSDPLVSSLIWESGEDMLWENATSESILMR